MRKKFSRVASLVLAVMMLISLLPTSILAAETGDTVTFSGTISFPDDAYLNGKLTVDVHAYGSITQTHRYWREDWVTDLDDIPFEIEFPSNEGLVSIIVQLSNTYETKTNLYTANNGAGGFVLTDDGMDPKGDFFSTVNMFSPETLAAADIVIPTGKELSGKITGDNLQVVDGEFVGLIFGDYFTRAYIDSETYEYTTVLPYGITAGQYTPYIEKGYEYNGTKCFESAASNILLGKYTTDAVMVDPDSVLENVNFEVDTGYALSGEVRFPEDGGFEYYNFEPVLHFGDTEYIINTAFTGISYDNSWNMYIPYMIAVPKSETPVSDIFNLYLHGYEDEVSGCYSMSNIAEGDYYYSSESENASVREEALATELTVAKDTENINFYLESGTFYSLEPTMPEGACDASFYYSFDIIPADGSDGFQTWKQFDVQYEDNYVSFVLPKEYIDTEVYYMYQVDANSISDDSTLYTGEVYLCQDGSMVTTKEEADTFLVTDWNEISFEFVEDDNITPPVTPDVPEKYTVNFSIKDEDTNEAISDALLLISDALSATSAGAISVQASESGWATAELYEGTYIVTTSANGYVTSTDTVEVVMDKQAVLIELKKETVTPDVPVLTETFFIVLDKETRKPVTGALISVIRSDIASTAGMLSLETNESGCASAALEEGTYTVTTTAGGYVTDCRDVKISGNAQEVPIWLERPEIVIGDNTTFTVRDGDVAETPAISGAYITLEDADGDKYTLKTDASGNASLDLEDGEYSVGVMADGYKARSFKIERSDTKNHFTIYLNKGDIIKVDSAVRELTKDEAEAAGVDTSAPENQHVYNCSAVLSFMPTVTIDYLYNEKGDIVGDCKPVISDNVAIQPVAKDIYLIVKSSTTWLKEIFEVQLVCSNTSVAETIKELTASLNIPEGLSLAAMKDSEQSADAVLGDIAPQGQADHSWYICGDAEGTYELDGTLTGKRVSGNVSEDIDLTFGIKDAINVLAGSAMKLTIEAEKTAYAGQDYRMRYTLENVSDKTLYNLSFNVFGGRFFEEFGITEIEYAHEYGTKAIEDVDGKGFIFETKEFKSKDKVSGVFTIKFGEGLDIENNTKWKLTDAFTITGAGSTTEIPTEIIWKESLPVHNWDEGTVTTAPTCTTDGVMTYECTDVDCEESYTAAIPATGHDMSDYVTTEPTCTEDGSKVSTCNNGNCDHKITLTIGKLGHDMGAYVTTVEPKCESTGTERSECSRCSHYEEKELPKKGHSWDDGVVTTKPTVDAEGERTHSCKNGCGKTKEESIPKLVPQEVGFMVEDITITYGEKNVIYNETYYNDSVEDGTVAYTSSDESVATVDNNGKVTILSAGETTITATAAATEKYTETSASYKLTINKAPLTVKPKTVDIFYGEAAVFSEVEGEGFVPGEDVSVLEGDAVFATEYKAYDKAGEYPVTVSGITAKNYEITFAPGVLNVKKAEKYDIALSMLSYRKGDEIKVDVAITPKDTTAEFKTEYQVDGKWTETAPTEIGTYKVRVSLVKSDNIAVPETPVYTEAELEIKAGAMITVGGDSFGIEMETDEEKGTVGFTADNETVKTVIDNVPSTGEVVIDATGATEGINTLVLPENIVKALDESDKVDSFTVIADDAEITMDSKVLTTAAKEMGENSTVSIKIDAVDKSELNDKQQEALDAISTDAHVIQLNLVVTNYDENGEPESEDIHELHGKVNIKAKYDLPDNMDGKRIVVCYVSDNGSVTYKRAEYKDGFVHFTTDHFSHYVIATVECAHEWNSGEVITPATTVSEGLMRYTCTICFDTKDEPIAKKTPSGGNGGGLAAGGDKSTDGADKLGNEDEKKEEEAQPEAPVVSAPKFGDLGAHSWAADAISALAEAGIIKGTSANTFSPAANITRADFAILLVRAFNLTSDNAENFADVTASDYFAAELAIARNTGIVGGIGGNKFAPRNAITRQDMMTIVYRALQNAKVEGIISPEMTDEVALSKTYTDFTLVSDYAKDAVSVLSYMHFVNGKNGRIAPNEYTTRAEVAVLLQRILEYVK